MLSASSWLSLPALIAVLCSAHDPEPSLNNNKPVSELNDGTRCSWNCTIMDSDFLEEMKTKIAKKKVSRFVVKYERRVNDNCVNQTSGNGSGNITEHWEIRLPSKKSSIFSKALESAANMMSCIDSVDENTKLMAICTLTPASTKPTEPTYYSSSSSKFFPYRLANLAAVKLDSIADCNTQTTHNLQPCKFSKSTGNSSSSSEGLLNCGGWADDVLAFLFAVFLAVFCYYSPIIFCLFSPTEVTDDGVHQIILDGASPVSLESLMGNYFFSREDTMWQRARLFVLRAFVFPSPFLGLAIIFEYLQQSMELLSDNFFGFSHPFQSWMIACYVCYIIVAFSDSFCISRSRERKFCSVCRLVKSKTFVCRGDLPKIVINHLRIQPLIIIHRWGLLMRYLMKYFEKCFLLIPSVCELSAMFLLRWFLFIILLSFSPAIIIILLMLMLLGILNAIFLTSPVMVLGDITGQLFDAERNFDNRLQSISYFILCLAVVIPAFVGISRLLMFSGVAMFMALVSAFVLLLSEESLPYVACFVLVLYYIWSTYSSFTNKYQDLALVLFKQVKSYETSRPAGHSQVTQTSPETDSPLQNTQTTVGNKDNVMKIPQKLFYTACEEIMPLRESVCALILKITILVSFVLLVFSVTILLNVGATPIMKTLILFLTGVFPKIVEIYQGGGNQKKIKAMIAEEKIPEIVREYIEGTSAENQQQVDSGSDVDV